MTSHLLASAPHPSPAQTSFSTKTQATLRRQSIPHSGTANFPDQPYAAPPLPNPPRKRNVVRECALEPDLLHNRIPLHLVQKWHDARAKSKHTTCDCSHPRDSETSPAPKGAAGGEGTLACHSLPCSAPPCPAQRTAHSAQPSPAQRPNTPQLFLLTLQPQASAAGPFLVPAADTASRWPSRHAAREKKKEQSFRQDAIVVWLAAATETLGSRSNFRLETPRRGGKRERGACAAEYTEARRSLLSRPPPNFPRRGEEGLDNHHHVSRCKGQLPSPAFLPTLFYLICNI